MVIFLNGDAVQCDTDKPGSCPVDISTLSNRFNFSTQVVSVAPTTSVVSGSPSSYNPSIGLPISLSPTFESAPPPQGNPGPVGGGGASPAKPTPPDDPYPYPMPAAKTGTYSDYASCFLGAVAHDLVSTPEPVVLGVVGVIAYGTGTVFSKIPTRQKNSWVSCGSGSLPSEW